MSVRAACSARQLARNTMCVDGGLVGAIIHEGDRSARQYGHVGEVVHEGRQQYLLIRTQRTVA
jgi:hypothetical protein